MIPILILMVGGVALAGTMFPDESDDETNTDDLLEEGSGSPQADDLTGLGQLLSEPVDTLESVPELETTGPEVSEIGGSIDWLDDDALQKRLNLDLSPDQSPFVGGVEYAIEDLEKFPTALTDWTTCDSVPVFNLGETEALLLRFPEGDQGSIVVLDADYFENHSGADGPNAVEYTGSNVYYVPYGESFPDQYEWSVDGATLYDTSDYSNDRADFGGIKLIARVDSGSTAAGVDASGQNTITFDNRIGDPEFLSNLKVTHI